MFTNALEIAYLTQDQLDAFKYMLARLGDAFESLAVAGKNLDAEFVFEFNDGLGHPGLRRVQGPRCLGQVQVTPDRLLDKAELVQVHIENQLTKRFIMPQPRGLALRPVPAWPSAPPWPGLRQSRAAG